MRKKVFRLFKTAGAGAALLPLLATLLVISCASNTEKSVPELAGVSNPFLGTWESLIPSMGNARMVSTYNADGTFTCGFPEAPGFEGPFNGAYVVRDGVMISFLAFEGAAGYRYAVVDNNTIDVTEITEVADGEYTLGNTSRFTRASGTARPGGMADTPFTMDNPLVGKWTAELPAEGGNPARVSTQEYRTNGVTHYTVEGYPELPDFYYACVQDGEVYYFVMFASEAKQFESFKFVVNQSGSLTVTEFLGVEQGQPVLGQSAEFIRAD